MTARTDKNWFTAHLFEYFLYAHSDDTNKLPNKFFKKKRKKKDTMLPNTILREKKNSSKIAREKNYLTIRFTLMRWRMQQCRSVEHTFTQAQLTSTTTSGILIGNAFCFCFIECRYKSLCISLSYFYNLLVGLIRADQTFLFCVAFVLFR